MIRGGVAVLDEGNRMSEKSWASLAPLLDDRRYIESIVAGITIPAASEFRAAVTMNQDESTFEVPDYILSRLQPTLQLGFPERHDEMAILQYHLPFSQADMLGIARADRGARALSRLRPGQRIAIEVDPDRALLAKIKKR